VTNELELVTTTLCLRKKCADFGKL